MMIPMGELLAKAKKEGYGVAAPNVFNRETIEACFLAAKKLRAPIILDVAAVHGIYECADIDEEVSFVAEEIMKNSIQKYHLL